ncbi:hypothetical protein CMI37_07410 [Candidatus Pacearchaeota archaeon]|nr:hypothetical protein [Candidatus Pacearchaeota archaeon]|tara:strand:- start:217 stop:600 length:384 start_codon:yes stop_codon:yes gene_type:complete
MYGENDLDDDFDLDGWGIPGVPMIPNYGGWGALERGTVPSIRAAGIRSVRQPEFDGWGDLDKQAAENWACPVRAILGTKFTVAILYAAAGAVLAHMFTKGSKKTRAQAAAAGAGAGAVLAVVMRPKF